MSLPNSALHTSLVGLGLNVNEQDGRLGSARTTVGYTTNTKSSSKNNGLAGTDSDSDGDDVMK